MKTMLCARCGELVPHGCCTCGPEQELVPVSREPEFVDLLAMELGRMLDWYDIVTKHTNLIGLRHIEETRAVYEAWKSAQLN